MDQNMDTNGICIPQNGLNEVNQNFYTMCRPTLFPLRFVGGPPGLWRFQSAAIKPRRYRKVLAFIMLVVLNLGAICDFAMAIRTSSHPNYSFDQNMSLFFVVGISVSGTLALDILWWRRGQLKELLNQIDFEPKMCEATDAKCQLKNQKEIRNKTIKMFLFILFFTGYMNFIYVTSESRSKDGFAAYKSFEFHLQIWLYALGFIAIYPFAVSLSLCISLSWIFRLKVKRIVKCVRENIELVQNGGHPDPFQARAIELWFLSYVGQFKKYDIIFKTIFGLVYVVMFWSILSLAEQTINGLFTGKWNKTNFNDLVHETLSVAVLVYFLYSLSFVELSLKKLVKLLFRLSLRIKFMDSSDESTMDLSEKYQLLAETVNKSGLNLSLFGLIHISRSLIITTFSILSTYGLLMYELFGDHNKSDDNCATDNSTTITLATVNQTTL